MKEPTGAVGPLVPDPNPACPTPTFEESASAQAHLSDVQFHDVGLALSLMCDRPAFEVHGNARRWWRVEFDHDRYLLAEVDREPPAPTAFDATTSTESRGPHWRVQLAARSRTGTTVLASASHRWIADAYSAAVAQVQGSWLSPPDEPRSLRSV
ncbi:hypothetical protein DW322_05295 [Rhodococcus rhodnii]|nr:hypothetical protein DW322_05295 [Rhodococcus rhodnii]